MRGNEMRKKEGTACAAAGSEQVKESVAAVEEGRREEGAAAAGKSVWCMRAIGGGSGAVDLKSAWGRMGKEQSGE